ncbi:MAG: HupE/UreJ family protein [Myxococcota bacterium]
MTIHRPTSLLRRALSGSAAALLGLGLCLTTTTAAAHAGSNKRIQAQVHPGGATLRVEVDMVDAAVALGLGASIEPDELRPHGVLIQRWLGRGLQVDSDSGLCTATATSPRLSNAGDSDDASLVVTLDYACPAPMGTVVLRDDTIFDEDPDHETFVSVIGANGEAQARVLRADDREIELHRTPSVTETAGGFLLEGGRHLVTGYDHMLFLLSLILAAGLLVRREGMRAALRDVAWVVTAFTLGHSVSLVAAALGWVALPARAVEIAIAGSIVLVALGNVARPQASVARPWLAAVFGLVHGFGFSSVLAELGLPTTHRVLALLSFNVGIEIAQLLLVAAVLVPLAHLARYDGYRRYVLQGASLAIAACGGLWLVERSLGL